MARWEHELRTLVATRGPALVGYAYALCRDRHEAEDLVQDALVKVYSRFRNPALRSVPTALPLDLDGGPANPEGYVRRAILHHYLDTTERRRGLADRSRLVAGSDVVRAPASGIVIRADVAAALAALSPKERACTVLRYYEDLTVPQVAVALGVAEGTAKRYLSDAAGKLRSLLGTTGERTATR